MFRSSLQGCLVPECTNNTNNSPEKLFILIPNVRSKCIKRRHNWLVFCGRPDLINRRSNLYICEDHFDLPNDMENYMEYKIMGSVTKIRMKASSMPSKLTPDNYEEKPNTFIINTPEVSDNDDGSCSDNNGFYNKVQVDLDCESKMNPNELYIKKEINTEIIIKQEAPQPGKLEPIHDYENLCMSQLAESCKEVMPEPFESIDEKPNKLQLNSDSGKNINPDIIIKQESPPYEQLESIHHHETSRMLQENFESHKNSKCSIGVIKEELLMKSEINTEIVIKQESKPPVQLESIKHYREVHTEVKPFKCKICSECFTRTDELVQHQRMPHIRIQNPFKSRVFRKVLITKNLSR